MSVKLIEKLKSYIGDKPDYEKLDILFNEHRFNVDFINQVYPNLIKTFSDLKFKPHGNNWMGDKAVQATLDFDNGRWISAVGGAPGLYGDGVNTFEIGFPISEEGDMEIIVYQSPESITEEIFKIQMKKPFKK